MRIPLSGHRSSCCTVRELAGHSVHTVGFAHLPLESWQLLMSFICSEVMKGDSVNAKVFVKAFLKPQETC